TQPYLSLIDKSIVGIPHLVEKLSRIQSALPANCLPRICHSLDDRINKSIIKLDHLAPPTARLAAFFRDLSPFIQNTSSPFLEFKQDDPSIAHPYWRWLKLIITGIAVWVLHLFDTGVDKSVVGIIPFVDKLSRIQSALLANCLPRICRSLDDMINKSIVKLDRLAPPTARLAAFLRVLSPFIQNTSSLFLEFKLDDPSIAHPKGLLKLLNRSRDWCDKAEAHIKSQFLFAFDNQCDDHLTAISKAVAYAAESFFFRYLPTVYKGIIDATALHFRTLITTLVEYDLHSHILQEIVSSGPLDMMEKFMCHSGYNKGIEEEELERELAMYAATKSIASIAIKWLPDGH
nr:dynamin-related protein 4C-like [Tanacetum cinerariifolium]